MRVVVLGMHKSGTTLVAQMLHHSGIHMGTFREDLDYDAGNTFEHHGFQAINRELLAPFMIPPLGHVLRRGRRPEVDAAGHPRNQDSQAWIRRRALEQRVRTGPIPDAARTLVEELDSAHADWGFKDPRTCLTYPLWQRILPPHRIVVVYRGLGQVLERYRAGIRHPMRARRVVQAWTIHNWAILRTVEQSETPVLVLRFEHLMSDPAALDDLSRYLERPIKDARDPNRYRSRSRDQRLPSWVAPLATGLPIHPEQLEARLAALEGTSSAADPPIQCNLTSETTSGAPFGPPDTLNIGCGPIAGRPAVKEGRKVAVQKKETSPIRSVDEPTTELARSTGDGGGGKLIERLPQIIGDFDVFVTTLKRQRRLLAFTIVGFASILGLLLATQTPLYESTALLLVKFGRELMYQPEVGESPQAFTQRDKQAVLNSELAILLSQPVMEGVARDVGLPSLYADLANRAAEIPSGDPQAMAPLYAEAAARLSLSLTAQALPEAHVIRISFRHPDPEVAASAVNAAVDHFTEKHLEAFAEPELVLFLTKRIEDYRESLRQTESALREFETEHRAFALDDPQGVLLQRRDEINREIVELEREISSLRRGALQEGNAISEARRELLTLELEQSRVRGKLRDDVSERIDVVKSFIAKRQREREQEVALLKEKWASLDEQRVRLDQDLRDHPMLSSRYRELRRERDATEEQYRTYSKRLREARLSHEMDREKLASINVIQPAFPAAEPIWPRGYLLSSAIVLVVAVVFGLLVVTACEAFSVRLPSWLRPTDRASGRS